MIRKYKLFELKGHEDVDPYGEEDWDVGDDDIIRKMRKELLHYFNELYGDKYDDKIKTMKFVPNKEEYIYEIVSYTDEGRKNGTLGFVEARSKTEARVIYVLWEMVNKVKPRGISDILFTGFYGAERITRAEIENKIAYHYQKLSELENIKDFSEFM